MPSAALRPVSAFRLCLVAGLTVLALAVWSYLHPAPPACGGLREGYAPILAFELARSAEDLKALFGDVGSTCQTTLIDALDRTNWLDTLVFIPIYGSFLAFFFVGIRERDARYAAAGFWGAILAVAGDLAENACLMNITPLLDPDSGWFRALAWTTALKWLSLAALAVIAAVIYARARARNWLAAAACVASCAGIVAAIVAPVGFGSMISLATSASWVVFLATAAFGAMRKVPGNAAQ